MNRLDVERGGSWQRYDRFAATAAFGFDGNDTVPSLTILIVEDEWLLRQALYDELKAIGWTVLEAASGERALAIQRAEAIDLLVTDIRLDGAMTGWELARRSREANPELPVIYVSGNKPDDAQRVGGGVFLSKPCVVERLVATCRELMAP